MFSSHIGSSKRWVLLLAAACAWLGPARANEEPGKRFSVVLDAGHGGTDAGIERDAGVEKDLALKVADRVASLLRSKPDVEPVLTRKGDYPLSFDERRRIANVNEPGIFMSLHFAAAPSPLLKGPRLYVSAPANVSDRSVLIPLEEAHALASARSLRLATVLTSTLQAAIPEAEMEIARLPLAPLLGITVPAILVECDFLTSRDASAWKDPETVERFSQLLFTAIDRFLSEVENPPP
ncbi:MAG: N-acetylmuramoyl-L-alanine amidase [Pseudomonadota bacterium]